MTTFTKRPRYIAVLITLGVVLCFGEFFAIPVIQILRLPFFIAFIYLIVKIIRASRSPKKVDTSNNYSPAVDHGSARWSTLEELEVDGFNSRREGLWISDGYFRHRQSHFLTIAGSRQGKGTNVIIPNLLINPLGSYVVTDPKGENAFITAKFQRSTGQKVYILDPWGEQGKFGAQHGIPASGFNPFDFIKHDPDELRDNCDLMAHYLVPDKPNSKDPYWDDRARTLIKTCLMHIITAYEEEKHNFWELYKMLRVSGENLIKMLIEMKLNTAGDGLVSLAAEEFLALDPTGNTLPGILSSAQNATTIFESPPLRRSLEKSDFNPYDLSNGKCTVYVVIPERFLESHAAWLRMTIGLCLKAVNAKPNRPVYFLLDEFPVLGKMPDIIKAYAFGAGQNIRLWCFSQSLSHIKDIYGENGMNALLSNVAVLQTFGITDPFTREFISQALGEATYSKTSYTSGTSYQDSGTSHSSGESSQTYGRRLMTAEEVGKFDRMIILTQKTKCVLNKLAYYERKPKPVMPEQKSKWQRKKDKNKPTEPVYEWADFFGERASAPPRVHN